MKSILPLIAVALACAACAGEPQSSPASAASVGAAAAPATPPSTGSPFVATAADATPAQPAGVEDLLAAGEAPGRAGRPHYTGAAPAAPPAAAQAAPGIASEPGRISPEELRPLLDAQQAVLVDVRGASDWGFHRAAEAIHIPYDQLRARSAELPHEALIALYCT